MVAGTELREMREEDLDGITALAAREGHPLMREDLARILARSEHGCFTLLHEEHIVGAVTTVPYLDYAVLGNLVLDPGVQGGGFELLLLNRALGALMFRGVRTVDIEARAGSEATLRHLGFNPVRETVVLAGHTLAAARRDPRVRQAEALDLMDVSLLDTETFAFGRKALFMDLMEEVPHGALVAYTGSTLAGYLFTRGSPAEWRVGPWVVAPGQDALASALLDHALTALPPGPVRIEVPAGAKEALALLEARGFRAVDRLVRMRWGDARAAPANTSGEYALAALATG